MFSSYIAAGFKLFPCNQDKTPAVPSWRAVSSHIDAEEAHRIADTGGYIGAWLPRNYIIIDIDMNHRAKDGTEKPPGLEMFRELTKGLGIEDDLFESTRVIKTGSGGFHLYFKLPDGTDYKSLSQKSLATSVDVRTHAGYVIAAGTNGYTVHSDHSTATLPAPFLDLVRKKATEKATEKTPERLLPVEVLERILDKLDVSKFSNNDDWQEFITASIAAAGNAEAVISALETWSQGDPNYASDPTVRKRIETFEPSGGITAGTFIHILKTQEISKYMVDRVRLHIGAEFSFSDAFAEQFVPPFNVDYSTIREFPALIEAFYYARNQTAAVALITKLAAGNILFADDERRFYTYTGNRWTESQGVLSVIFSLLLNAGLRYYSDVSKAKDADANEYFNQYVAYIGSIATQQRMEAALRQHPDVARSKVPWDAPSLESTLTLDDCVMDFTEKGSVTFRPGQRNEYRRLYIDLQESDFQNLDAPTEFKGFLKDVFPNEDTRKTATYALSTMLSGTGKFRKFQIWNGSGSNGKSALMDIMTRVIGRDRAVSYSAEILLSSRPNNSLTPELAALRGALVAFGSETEESKRISQGIVKHLTGDEEMTANPKYQGLVTFTTGFQLVLSTNYLPSFSAHDNAFVDRLLILPFYSCFYDSPEKQEAGKRGGSRYFFPARDITEVKAEVLKERAAILYYLARRYQDLGISIPESDECREAKAHYVSDNNGIVDLIHEVVEFDETGTKDWFTPTADVTNYYNDAENTKYSSKWIIMRIKEVLPLAENHIKRINGKLTRGLKNIRLTYGAYPEGYTGNFTPEEVREFEFVEAQF